MNHIKTFKLFESDSYDEIKINCEDILIDISDNGIKVAIPHLKSQNVLGLRTKDYFQIKIGQEDSINPIKLGDFKDDIKRLLTYMKEEGFELSSKSYCVNDDWGHSECCPSCRSQSIVIPNGRKDDSILMCNNCNYKSHNEQFLTSYHPIKDDITYMLDNNYYVHLLSLIFTR